jgi:hypothetical protein
METQPHLVGMTDAVHTFYFFDDVDCGETWLFVLPVVYHPNFTLGQ